MKSHKLELFQSPIIMKLPKSDRAFLSIHTDCSVKEVNDTKEQLLSSLTLAFSISLD